MSACRQRLAFIAIAFDPEETRMKTLARKPLLTIGLCLFGNVFASVASAQPSAGDKAVATQLFEDGRSLLDRGKFDLACPKLEESERLDPGGGTLLNVALCHERQGRTATAWVEFVEARGIAKADGRSQRVTFAQTHIDELEPALSRLVVQVPDESDLPDLEIRRDGSVVGRAAWGTAVPVDPGDHVLEASAPGDLPWRQSIVVGAAADTKTVVVPALRPAPVASAAPSTSGANHGSAVTAPPATELSDVAQATDAPAPASHRDSGASALVVGGWVSLAVGLGAAGVSTYFGLRALALKHDADGDCPSRGCTAEGASKNHDAIQAADAATGFAVAGGVGIGIGAALLIARALSHESPSPVGSNRGPALLGFDVSGGSGAGVMTVRGQW